ncbi:MAG: aldehyde dehydrogenase family protein [Phycisphaerales bacterium]
MTPFLRTSPSDYINGEFLPIPGDALVSTNPANPGEIIWSGKPDATHVDAAVRAARAAFPAWSGLDRSERVEHLTSWQQVVRSNAERIADLICAENGKTIAEAKAEAGALASKVDITLEPDGSIQRVTDYEVRISDTRVGRCSFRPHGVVAVIGPFNFPAHLPNGHWIPALAMGDTIVFKPSEKTAAVGQLLAELWHEVGLPRGVFNLVQGAGDVAARLVDHDDLDAVMFTGSWPVGRKILETNLDRPGRLIALEMGGNNPAVVMDDAHLRQAVIECVRAGFATTGQRCTCTRRVIVHEPVANRFLDAFVKAAGTIRVGPGRSEPPVFCGPLINDAAVQSVLDFQQSIAARGGRILLEAHRPEGLEGHFITPGVVQVDRFQLDQDCEIFGPLVQVSIARDLDDAIEQANATRFGLAAAIFTTNQSSADRFVRECRAGCVNVNNGTAGASSKLPFGGLGASGNHRPAGAFSLDYCVHPVASLQEGSDEAAAPAGMEFDDAWLG